MFVSQSLYATDMTDLQRNFIQACRSKAARDVCFLETTGPSSQLLDLYVTNPCSAPKMAPYFIEPSLGSLPKLQNLTRNLKPFFNETSHLKPKPHTKQHQDMQGSNRKAKPQSTKQPLSTKHHET